MRRIELQEYFKNGRVLVAKETFAIVKAVRACAEAFAVIRDSREISCIIDESKLRRERYLGIERGWRLITFDMVLPFSLVGFIAEVSGALAAEGISIIAVSSYSTDHVFVKNKDLDMALETLRKLGFFVVQS